MKKKIYKIIKSKSGVTLVELIVGIVLFALISLSVSLVFGPTMNMYTKVSQMSEISSICNTIANEISGELSYILTPAIISQNDTLNDKIEITTIDDKVVYQVNYKGLLTRNGNDVLKERYYKGRSIKLHFEEISTPDTKLCYNIIITILDKNGNDTMTRTYTVCPLTLSINQYNA